MSGIDEPARWYPASWNERDPARRQALVDELWTDDAGHLEPLVSAEDRDAIEALVATAHRQCPGPVYRPAGNVDGQHGVARPAWEPGPVGSPPLITGLVVMVTGHTRLRHVHGFLDPVPAHTPSPGAGS
ncbi:nuclear transport factor 2 family protein [Streptomyces sp. NPDC047928]|uniref:nuclear transport factor 2 family protein n=1 Tax=unclassified Streptomyces TaxID=2593676 RepID=UPI00371EBB3A